MRILSRSPQCKHPRRGAKCEARLTHYCIRNCAANTFFSLLLYEMSLTSGLHSTSTIYRAPLHRHANNRNSEAHMSRELHAVIDHHKVFSSTFLLSFLSLPARTIHSVMMLSCKFSIFLAQFKRQPLVVAALSRHPLCIDKFVPHDRR